MNEDESRKAFEAWWLESHWSDPAEYWFPRDEPDHPDRYRWMESVRLGKVGKQPSPGGMRKKRKALNPSSMGMGSREHRTGKNFYLRNLTYFWRGPSGANRATNCLPGQH